MFKTASMILLLAVAKVNTPPFVCYKFYFAQLCVVTVCGVALCVALSLQVCASTSLRFCKSALLQVCASASLRFCKSALLQDGRPSKLANVDSAAVHHRVPTNRESGADEAQRRQVCCL
jgi:hypothetical protein